MSILPPRIDRMARLCAAVLAASALGPGCAGPPEGKQPDPAAAWRTPAPMAVQTSPAPTPPAGRETRGAKIDAPTTSAKVLSNVVESVAPAATPNTSPANTLPGNTSPASAGHGSDRPVATIGGQAIPFSQIEKPLVEAYGLNMLLQVIQLELAKQDAAKVKVAVTPQDVNEERASTLKTMFPEADPGEYPALLEQFLTQQRITKPEFGLVLETNTYLRKIAEPQLKDKITEANIKDAFNVLYGEKVKIRVVALETNQKAVEAKRRVAAGEPFDQVAFEMSADRQTGALRGEMPEFSRATQKVPEVIKETAFSLKEGEVSDIVQTNNAFYVLKLEQRIPPGKAVKYELLRQGLFDQLYAGLVQQTVKQLRGQLGAQALAEMKILDPMLNEQFEQRKNAHQTKGEDKKEAREDLRARIGIRPKPATAPASQPGPPAPPPPAATGPGPASTQEAGRPPATGSGAGPAAPGKAQPTTSPSLK